MISTEQFTKTWQKTHKTTTKIVWSKMLSVADEQTNCAVYYNMKYYMRNNKYEILFFF